MSLLSDPNVLTVCFQKLTKEVLIYHVWNASQCMLELRSDVLGSGPVQDSTNQAKKPGCVNTHFGQMLEAQVMEIKKR